MFLKAKKINRTLFFVFIGYVIIMLLTTEIHAFYGESELFNPPEIYFIAFLLPSPIVLAISSILAYYISKTIEYITPEVKMRFKYLEFFFIFMALDVIIVMLGWGYLYITRDPLGYIDLIILKIRIFILCSAYVYYALAYASYWLLKFSIEISDKKSKHIEVINILLFIISLTLATHPANYYGRYPPVGEFSLKPITALLIVIYLVFSAMYGMLVIAKRIKTEKDLIKRFRFKILNLGFILLITSFISYVIYAILLSMGLYTTATIYVIISSSSLPLSMISLYIGLNTPQRVLEYVRKKYSKF